ncbi:MAG: hypothetical protein M1818_003225 [Claussenomyces sp. TS43310]|nr:MAG: hypothetical protein M1818_003225 [Claussenomyces sp. TS43310]
MNNIRQIQELNRRELEANISPNASWHADYRDTAYIYIGGLPYELSEGDLITIFSQFGEPTYVNLVRDKETGKSRGFAFLKYEDQRSTDLAVDNLGGAVIMGRTLRVDHTRYKRKDDEPDEGTDLTAVGMIEPDDESIRNQISHKGDDEEVDRSLLKEERELAALIRDHDDDDPMKAFLVQEKKDEVARAVAKLRNAKTKRVSDDIEPRHHRHRISRTKGTALSVGIEKTAPAVEVAGLVQKTAQKTAQKTSQMTRGQDGQGHTPADFILDPTDGIAEEPFLTLKGHSKAFRDPSMC